MAKIIKLPEHAFKQTGSVTVAGHSFTDGKLVLSDEDAAKVFKKFVNFYGCTVEDVTPIEADDDDSDDGEPSLSADQTKGA